MKISQNLCRFMLLVILMSVTTLALADNTSNKWRLQFSGGADSDGVIVFTITPVGAEAIVASVSIEKGRSENHVAKDVVDGLKLQLPSDAFHIERDDGEDVLVKRKHGAANFGIEITSNTVKGVRINPDKE